MNDVTPGLEWNFPSGSGESIEPALKRLLCWASLLAVVFAAAAFLRVEEALVGVAVAVELAFLRATLGLSQLEPKHQRQVLAWPWLGLAGFGRRSDFLGDGLLPPRPSIAWPRSDPRGCVRLETRTLPPLPKADRFFPTGNRPAWRFPDGMACGCFVLLRS